MDSSSNETSNSIYGTSSKRNQLDYNIFNAEHIGPESSRNMNLAAAFGHFESCFREDLNSQIPSRPAFGSADMPISQIESKNFKAA